jgi:hypothetical protein
MSPVPSTAFLDIPFDVLKKGSDQAIVMACQGKEHALNIMLKVGMGMGSISENGVCKHLPKDSDIFELYGVGPIVHGLETCKRYRSYLSANANNGTAVEPLPRVAGLYNSGTNAFQQSLNENIKRLPGEHDYEVPWGKHVPPRHRLVNFRPRDNKVSKKHTLPVVLIRDPYWWMQGVVRTLFEYHDSTRRRETPHSNNFHSVLSTA